MIVSGEYITIKIPKTKHTVIIAVLSITGYISIVCNLHFDDVLL